MKDPKKNLYPIVGYLKRDEDEALIKWLIDQPGKSKIVRIALEDYWHKHTNGQNLSKNMQASINPEAIYEAVDQALANRLDLGSIRQVVEAGVSNALANLPINTLAVQNGQQTETEENWQEDFEDFIID